MDFPENNLNKPYAGNSTLNIPGYLPEFQGEAGQLRRQALSMAINRDEITKVIFSGTRIPAKDFTSPAVDGYNENVAGSEVLKFDAAKAKDLWAKADAISPWPADKTLQLAYNTDGGNKEWIDAVANNFKNNLGIKAEGQPFAKFAEILKLRTAKELPGLTRAGWQADYPSLYNFLGPLLRPAPAPTTKATRTPSSTSSSTRAWAPSPRTTPTRSSPRRRRSCSRTSPTCRCGTPHARLSGARMSATLTPAGTAFRSTGPSRPSNS